MSIPVTYIEKFVDDPDAVFARLQKGLEWERRSDAPRSEYYCNDFNEPYVYGRGRGQRTYYPRPYSQDILVIRAKLEAHCNAKFEVCFLNRYLNQSDHLGWHADASPEMDDERPIVSVSLGVPRKIQFAPQANPKDISEILLAHGSACIMAPGMQDTHFHRIPKASFQCGERISLTFRGYIHPVKEQA